MGIIEGIKDAIGIMDDIGDYTDSVSKVMNKVNVSMIRFKLSLSETKSKLKAGEIIEVNSKFASQFKEFFNVENEVKKAVSRLQSLFSSLNKTNFAGKQPVVAAIKKHIQELNLFMATYKKTISKIEALEIIYKKARSKKVLITVGIIATVAAAAVGVGYLVQQSKQAEESAMKAKKEQQAQNEILKKADQKEVSHRKNVSYYWQQIRKCENDREDEVREVREQVDIWFAQMNSYKKEIQDFAAQNIAAFTRINDVGKDACKMIEATRNSTDIKTGLPVITRICKIIEINKHRIKTANSKFSKIKTRVPFNFTKVTTIEDLRKFRSEFLKLAYGYSYYVDKLVLRSYFSTWVEQHTELNKLMQQKLPTTSNKERNVLRNTWREEVSSQQSLADSLYTRYYQIEKDINSYIHDSRLEEKTKKIQKLKEQLAKIEAAYKDKLK